MVDVECSRLKRAASDAHHPGYESLSSKNVIPPPPGEPKIEMAALDGGGEWRAFSGGMVLISLGQVFGSGAALMPEVRWKSIANILSALGALLLAILQRVRQIGSA